MIIPTASQRIYLVLSLQSLVHTITASPALYSTHLKLLISPGTAVSPGPTRILKFARKYTSKSPTSASVWLARLDAEKCFSPRDDIEKAWANARSNVVGDAHDVEQVWIWGLDLYSADEVEDQVKIYEVCFNCYYAGTGHRHRDLLIIHTL